MVPKRKQQGRYADKSGKSHRDAPLIPLNILRAEHGNSAGRQQSQHPAVCGDRKVDPSSHKRLRVRRA